MELFSSVISQLIVFLSQHETTPNMGKNDLQDNRSHRPSVQDKKKKRSEGKSSGSVNQGLQNHHPSQTPQVEALYWKKEISHHDRIYLCVMSVYIIYHILSIPNILKVSQIDTSLILYKGPYIMTK